MTMTAPSVDTFTITEEILVHASKDRPLFMSTGATSNLMYRLEEKDGGTLISFRHTVVGPFPEEQREGTSVGWTWMNGRIKRAAEAAGQAS